MTERFRDLKSSIEKSSSDYQKKATILQARLEKLDRKLDDRIAAAVEERGKQKTWMVPFVVLAGAVLGLTAFVYTRYRKLAKSTSSEKKKKKKPLLPHHFLLLLAAGRRWRIELGGERRRED
eukprot:CAMPEP_0194577126 /NCGR_PEP_ID=MMETSP0292-20121207/12016_1 /TAXON_ID=39354 /ORGANISM="Heterosigma akashiwo, Strain CCMP2393" /LENGTH=121 /DNA_ID=CAMNT_0039429413 /DNA_START=331 /DNA_END=697 /DNA_ORIENTATION=-